MDLMTLSCVAAFTPLVGAMLAGFLGWKLGRAFSHTVTIASVAISFAASFACLLQVMNGAHLDAEVYTWLEGNGWKMQVGFLIDRLTVTMMCVVTFVSLMVHVYTIGYMADDPGYQRFFAYISLFTFSMLMLVMSNNFLQLIFGCLLCIGLILANFGTLDYATVFSQSSGIVNTTIEIIPGVPWLLISVICICLFIGAMAKSAQVPLHVWLPDSMEGPTPISALIHAATMVTAGIFMVSRMSPLFELSQAALSFVLVIGGITAFFMALIAVVQYDIKRVIAYSTLSQLGYMTVALGASAYSVGMFHLMTHAFFKALLFLAAGSVIIALHHEQDMRKMGGLRKYMPITYITMLIGALANAGLPPFAGFFSKDSILEAVQLSHTPGAGFAYLMVLAGVFVGGLYSFRLVFYAFHGEERFAAHGAGGRGRQRDAGARAGGAQGGKGRQ